MTVKSLGNETLIQIEETQSALRYSIEQAKALAEESERLVQQHRAEGVQSTDHETASPRTAN